MTTSQILELPPKNARRKQGRPTGCSCEETRRLRLRIAVAVLMLREKPHQLAKEYRVSARTIRNWVREVVADTVTYSGQVANALRILDGRPDLVDALPMSVAG